MACTNKNKHLSLSDRQIILTGILNGSSKKSIADTLGKDKSTIGKEIKLHRQRTYISPLSMPCNNYKHCKYNQKCSDSCPGFIPFSCSKRDRSPGVCNGCSQIKSCRFDHYMYKPDLAHKEYREALISSRIGVNATLQEIRELGHLIEPLLKSGLSIYQIIQIHPEINLSEKTLYNYIENHVFKDAGIDISVLDLRRQTSRKISKKRKTEYKKREDRRYLVGRTYKDYETFVEDNPMTNTVQMDTVYNDGSNGPFIQTFKFIKYGFLFAILHEQRNAQSMVDGVDLLENIIGTDLFRDEVNILLTDRGSEFIKAEELELGNDSTKRTRVFYCDPMQSGQKGSLENKHIELRYILPKRIDLRKLGLETQTDMNIALSHINSAPTKKLNGKSPLELMQFLNPKLFEKFIDYGIALINKDKIVLKPYLLKK